MIADENWKPKCRYRQEDPVDLFYWRLAVWAILSVDKSTAKLEAGWARQARTGVGAGTLQTKDEDKYKSEKKNQNVMSSKEPGWYCWELPRHLEKMKEWADLLRRRQVWMMECRWVTCVSRTVGGNPGKGPGQPGNGLKAGGKTDQEGRREGNMRRTRDILTLYFSLVLVCLFQMMAHIELLYFE